MSLDVPTPSSSAPSAATAFRKRPTEGPSVEVVYARLAPFYDLVYGVALGPGRRRAMRRLAPMAGERILEVGTGTGLGAIDYPAGCRVVAVDLSHHMLARAHRRLGRHGLSHVALCRMDAAQLALPDGAFDAVYAPYVVNVVTDPVHVVREMLRVCRLGGRIVLLNHFRTANGEARFVDRLLGRIASVAGRANWELDLGGLAVAAGLTPVSVERVNLPRVSSVVVCLKT